MRRKTFRWLSLISGISIILAAVVVNAFGKGILFPKSLAQAQRTRRAIDGELTSANPQQSDLAENTVDFWRDEIIYAIFVDRFYDGDRSNNFDANPDDPTAFQGGDLEGVIQKLDYIKELGATAILLNPITDSPSYHGYHVRDHFSINSNYGDLSTYKKLVREAHNRDLKVLFDLVSNHTSKEHRIYQESRDWFREPREIFQVNEWSIPEILQSSSFYGLPDLKQEDNQVYEYLLDYAKFWIDTGIDGFRMDAVTLISPQFWKKIYRDIKEYAGDEFLILGEIYEPDPYFLNPYVKYFDAIFDFRTYYAVSSITEGMDRNNYNNFQSALNQDKLIENEQLQFFTFIDNHDVWRFVSQAKNEGQYPRERFKFALAYLMTRRGTPTILYGTEIALENEPRLVEMEDPYAASRSPMVFAGNKDYEIFRYLQKLIRIRKSFDFNRIVSLEPVRVVFDSRLMGTIQTDRNGQSLFVFHNAGDKTYNPEEDEKFIKINVGYYEAMPRDGYLVDLLTDERFQIEDDYTVIPMKPYQSRIFKAMQRPK